LLLGQSRLFRVVPGKLTFRLDYIAKLRRTIALRPRERVVWQLDQASDDKESLTRMRESKMMRRDQAMPAAGHVLSAPDVIAKVGKASLDNSPSAAIVVPLEVADILQDYVLGAVPLQNFQNLVEERSPCLVARSTLVARL